VRNRTVALSALLVALVAPSATGLTPPAARGWLGTWTTNYGEVWFYDVHRQKSDYPDAQGNPQYFWQIHGAWRSPGAYRTIEAALVEEQDFLTLGGCWVPSPEPTNCARILIYRSGGELTGGYWKTCRDYCKSHHPWKGEFDHENATVRFRFNQRGAPDGRRDLATQMVGTGSIVHQSARKAKRERGIATAASKVFLILGDGSAAPRIEFAVDSAYSPDPLARRDQLNLEATVTRSGEPACPVGAAAGLSLTDGRGGVPDAIELSDDTDSDDKHPIPCQLDIKWTSADADRVNVRLDLPD
jgi:hypothetical protein